MEGRSPGPRPTAVRERPIFFVSLLIVVYERKKFHYFISYRPTDNIMNFALYSKMHVLNPKAVQPPSW